MAFVRTQYGRVLTTGGRVLCECCEPVTPPPDGGGGGGGECNKASDQFWYGLIPYPPDEGYGTVFGGHITFHLTHDEFIAYTQTSGKMRETVSSELRYDLEMPTSNGAGSVLVERYSNTGSQQRLYAQPPDAVEPVFPDFASQVLYTPCYFRIDEIGWAELGSPSSYNRFGVSQDGFYSTCNIPLGAGLTNLGGVPPLHTARVIIIEDDREGIADNQRVHILLARLIFYAEKAVYSLLSPFNSQIRLLQWRSEIAYFTFPTQTSGPHPPFPSGSTSSITATVLGKSMTLYPSFSVEAFNFDTSCPLFVTGYNWSNVSSVVSYDLEFVPDPP